MSLSKFKNRRFKPKRRQILLVQSWWEDRVFKGVASYAVEHDWVLDCRMRWSRELPKTWHGDGIIAYTGIATPQQHLIDFVKAQRVPVVETQTPRIAGSGAVVVPHERIGALAAEHLLSLDFQHIGFVTFAENVFEAIRREGARKAVTGAGATFHALDFAKFEKQLPSLPKPLGLIALNDINALGVILACTAAKFSIPEEIAVIGADDTEIFCDLAPVPISSVNCDYEEQGRQAAALLDAMMDGKSPPAEPIVIEPHGVTVRRSTDTVAIPDKDSARFLRYLRDNFRELMNLEQAAQDLGVSMRRVQDNFRRYLKHTVIQELTRLRVEHAKKLLQDDPDLKVEAVGMDSGFANRFHFMKAFVRVTRQTPGQYRKSLRNAEAAK